MKMFVTMKLINFVTLFALVKGDSVETISIKLDSWMKDLAPHIKDMPLTDIAIPGSHDSMTYSISGFNGIGPDTDVVHKHVLEIFPLNVFTVELWARTQSLNTMQQLRSGIRFLDLRLATKPSTNDFFSIHGLYAGEISRPLKQIKEFVDTHHGEVVILYFQHFYEFTVEDHKRLIKDLHDLYGSRLVPRPFSMVDITLNNLARRNQSIIIVYKNYVGYAYPKLWYPNMLMSPWPDKQSTSDLLQYYYEFTRPYKVLYVHQAVLTPSGGFIIKGFFSNLLEECAKPVLRDVLPVIASDFFPGPVRHKRPAPVNVVIADFVGLENNLFPRTIIALNDKLYPPSDHLW